MEHNVSRRLMKAFVSGRDGTGRDVHAVPSPTVMCPTATTTLRPPFCLPDYAASSSSLLCYVLLLVYAVPFALQTTSIDTALNMKFELGWKRRECRVVPMMPCEEGRMRAILGQVSLQRVASPPSGRLRASATGLTRWERTTNALR